MEQNAFEYCAVLGRELGVGQEEIHKFYRKDNQKTDLIVTNEGLVISKFVGVEPCETITWKDTAKEKSPAPAPEKDDQKSEVQSQKKTGDNSGGIDFRGLPIATQPMLSQKLEVISHKLPEIDLDGELREIQNMIERGITPSTERIKDCAQASCKGPDCRQAMDKVISCIADILRNEEEEVRTTDPALREILILLENNSIYKL